MRAYPETLLPNARSLLADMLDYAVGDAGEDIDFFFGLFAASDYARRIERGDRTVLTGQSGVELARRILQEKAGRRRLPPARQIFGRTPVYWSGWITAFYQWHSNRTFLEILEALPPSVVVQAYPTFHEAPEERFAEMADAMVRKRFPDTRLKRIRSAYGCSQSQLAAYSGVGIRSIQMYEQRRKDINRAAGETLRALSRALGCDIDAILEP